MTELPLQLSSLKKQPSQPRARRTVERIIAATGELILAHGLDALTTNRVAEQANVNIATLYQYFPHKQALLSALLQTHMHDLTRHLNALLEGLGEASVADSTRLWATLGIQYFRQNDSLLGMLIQSQHALSALPEGKEFERRLLEAMHRFLSRQRDRLQVEDLDRAIYVALHACTAILSRHLLEPVPYYRDEEIVEEVVTLMTRYFYRQPATVSG
ncbi:TetR/AcrR family transcriptional regulator [Alcanivorax sediminis]|uniref:TetR family transcriptional regulator n=1 Tax=Alcanivorax sediminis TaxID=2663008 RepID=A0A6N7LQY4_9GAMM|nr:TetR/AcrR family transcriptional regulator [Alcanivorax sediminis]MQX52583.1 TetR family transcriptional regulator [Alcanivorax sediminis]